MTMFLISYHRHGRISGRVVNHCCVCFIPLCFYYKEVAKYTSRESKVFVASQKSLHDFVNWDLKNRTLPIQWEGYNTMYVVWTCIALIYESELYLIVTMIVLAHIWSRQTVEFIMSVSCNLFAGSHSQVRTLYCEFLLLEGTCYYLFYL